MHWYESCNIKYASQIQRRAARAEVPAGVRELIAGDPVGKIPAGPEIPQRSGAGAAVPHIAHHHRPGVAGTGRSAGWWSASRDRALTSGRRMRRRRIAVRSADSDLGQTEIFEPICQGIAGAPQASRHALLWGHHDPAHAAPKEQALALCDQFIERRVSGVFFAPLEMAAQARETNLASCRAWKRRASPSCCWTGA
jgi:hypothetical protein